MRRHRRRGIGCRELEGMLAERGVTADHEAVHHRVQRHAPEMERRVRWTRKRAGPNVPVEA